MKKKEIPSDTIFWFVFSLEETYKWPLSILFLFFFFLKKTKISA